MTAFWDIVKLLVVLGLVLMAIVYVIKFGLVRMQPGFHQQKGTLKIIERLPVSQKSGLFLVQVGKRYYLLGVSTDNINMLTEINSDEILPALPSNNGPSFKHYLDNLLVDTGGSDSFKSKMKAMIREKVNGRPSGDKDK